ncbi:hypothetical protein BDD14_6653 [Edaphobacter modestus]|uniref:Uncharacterized protein n=1 Tax=Edaphobacter modestus TaxID=388466 RepID=A0A4Q7Y0H6_9BACT|nr:hypothetical protein BDD14_6653 [Edaphobacter modestus]
MNAIKHEEDDGSNRHLGFLGCGFLRYCVLCFFAFAVGLAPALDCVASNFLVFAQRALCAAAIRSRASWLIGPRPLLILADLAPLIAVTDASNGVLAALRSP